MKYLSNLLLMFVSVAISLAIVESYFYIFPEYYVYKERVFCSGDQQRYQFHPVLGRTAIPGSHYFESKSLSDGWYEFTANEDGFRAHKQSGAEYVVVLGDSYTRGTLADNDETYPALLDSWMSDVTFLNYGTGGYGTAQSLLVYREFGKRNPHKYVILGYYLGNDIIDNVDPAPYRPRFEIVGGGLVQTSRPRRPENMSEDSQAQATEKQSLWRESITAAKKSIIFKFHHYLYKEYRTYNYLNRMIRPWMVPEEYGIFENFDADQAAELSEALLVELAKEVESNNARLLIVEIPSWNELMGYERSDILHRQRSIIDNLDRVMQYVDAIDLTDSIRKAGIEETHGIANKHFNEYGYYIAAKQIALWLKDNQVGEKYTTVSVPDFDRSSLTSPEPICR